MFISYGKFGGLLILIFVLLSGAVVKASDKFVKIEENKLQSALSVRDEMDYRLPQVQTVNELKEALHDYNGAGSFETDPAITQRIQARELLSYLISTYNSTFAINWLYFELVIQDPQKIRTLLETYVHENQDSKTKFDQTFAFVEKEIKQVHENQPAVHIAKLLSSKHTSVDVFRSLLDSIRRSHYHMSVLAAVAKRDPKAKAEIEEGLNIRFPPSRLPLAAATHGAATILADLALPELTGANARSQAAFHLMGALSYSVINDPIVTETLIHRISQIVEMGPKKSSEYDRSILGMGLEALGFLGIFPERITSTLGRWLDYQNYSLRVRLDHEIVRKISRALFDESEGSDLDNFLKKLVHYYEKWKQRSAKECGELLK